MNLPDAFIQSTRLLLGEEAFSRLAATLEVEAPTSIRLNPARLPDGLCLPRHESCGPCFETCEPRLDVSQFHLDPRPSQPEPCQHLLDPRHRVPWSTQGYYLDARPAFTFDPLLHAGCYYVQEASSMFLEQVMHQHLPGHPVLMLDLCAAPGGKSTHARSLLPQGSLLVANEVVRPRAQVLAENLTKWGHSDVVVASSDPSAFGSLKGIFDIVLADVPCSGEGMFRKDQGAVGEWSAEAVHLCASRQRRIVADVWPTLRPGGLLIYSTCTYNVHENEENVSWICSELGAEVLPVDVPSDWQIAGNLLPESSSHPFPVYRFLPHLMRGEGLFMAVLRKSGEDEKDSARLSSSRGKKGKAPTLSAPQALYASKSLIRNWLDNPDRYECLAQGTQLIAFPRPWAAHLRALKTAVHILQAGIPLAEVRGRDFVPTQALAMSTALRTDAFPRVELDYRQALAYLRREAISLPGTAPRGHVLVAYRAIPLGFVKNLGPRANNLYPQEWRIRTTYGLNKEVSVL